MKLNAVVFVLVNVLIAMLGILFTAVGVLEGNSFTKPLLESIGIGLLAAGLVNIFDHAVSLKEPALPIEIAADKREDTPKHIFDLKYNARKVDIIGVSLHHFSEELLDDSTILIKRLLKHNLQLRIFFVDPASSYLVQRCAEDKDDLSELVECQKQAVRNCVEFYKRLQAEYENQRSTKALNTRLTGSLRIILLDCCPYLTVYRVDEKIFWGLYASHTNGVHLPLFKTTVAGDPSLYDHLHQHIHALMEHSGKARELVTMPDLGKPSLAEDVKERALSYQVPAKKRIVE